MEICFLSTDDPQRVWQPGEEPAASAARPRNDAGGSRGAQRCPRHRGQPHRGRQARPPSLNGAEVGRSRWTQRKRSAPLSTRPASCPLSKVVRGRPISRRAYFVLNVCRSGTTELTGAIFILAHPLPLVSARRFAGAGEKMVRKFLALVACLALRMPARRASPYAQASSKRLDRPDWRRNGRKARRATARAKPG
jgi:hypothetical protein